MRNFGLLTKPGMEFEFMTSVNSLVGLGFKILGRTIGPKGFSVIAMVVLGSISVTATEVVLSPNPIRYGEQLNVSVVADSTVVSANVQLDQNWLLPLQPSQYNIWKTEVFLDPKRMDPNIFRLTVNVTDVTGRTETQHLTYYVQSGELLDGSDQTHIQILPGEVTQIAVSAPKTIKTVAAAGKLLTLESDGIWRGQFAPGSSRFPVQPKVQVKLFKSDGTYISKEVTYELPDSRLSPSDRLAKDQIESTVSGILAELQNPKTPTLSVTPSYRQYLLRRNFLLKVRNSYAIDRKLVGSDDSKTVLRRLSQFQADLSDGVRTETIALELEGLNLKNCRSDFQIPQSWDEQSIQRELNGLKLKEPTPIKQLKLIDAEISQLEISMATTLAQDRQDRLLSKNASLNDQNAKALQERNELKTQKEQLESVIEELSDSLKKKIDAQQLGNPEASEPRQ